MEHILACICLSVIWCLLSGIYIKREILRSERLVHQHYLHTLTHMSCILRRSLYQHEVPSRIQRINFGKTQNHCDRMGLGLFVSGLLVLSLLRVGRRRGGNLTPRDASWRRLRCGSEFVVAVVLGAAYGLSVLSQQIRVGLGITCRDFEN